LGTAGSKKPSPIDPLARYRRNCRAKTGWATPCQRHEKPKKANAATWFAEKILILATNAQYLGNLANGECPRSRAAYGVMQK
jgi:hypothetical protein